jgi:hypothetical protein
VTGNKKHLNHLISKIDIMQYCKKVAKGARKKNYLNAEHLALSLYMCENVMSNSLLAIEMPYISVSTVCNAINLL